MTANNPVDVQHDSASHRFTTSVDGHTGYVEYEPAADGIVITHTIVPSAIGGRGIAGQLVAAAVAHARQAGWTVASRCSYADAWLDRHPEHADLRR